MSRSRVQRPRPRPTIRVSSQGVFHSTYFTAAGKAVDPASSPRKSCGGRRRTPILVIDPGFGDAVRGGSPFRSGLIVDGSDNNVAAAVQNYAREC